MCVPLAGSASSCCGISWLALSHMSTVVILRVQFQVPLGPDTTAHVGALCYLKA